MFKVLFGTSIPFSSHRPILPETHTILSLSRIQAMVKLKISSTFKLLRISMKREALEARVMIMSGILNRPTKIFCALILLLFLPGI